MSDHNTKSLPAIKAQVCFGESTIIDGYLLESGEIRYSKAGTALLLRTTNNWINELELKTPALFKVLLRKGFSNSSQRVSVKREGKRGATIAETISGDDLDILIEFEAKRSNKKAIALLTAGWRQYRIDQSRHAFGLKEREQEEKLSDFQDWFEARLANDEDWDAIAEQEECASSDHALMFDGFNYTTLAFMVPSAATGYDNDPDCYQSPMK